MKRTFLLVYFVINLFFSSLVVDAATVTSDFGWRTHPIHGDERFHAGVDLAYDYGMPIGAVFAGRVVYADWWGGYGNCVILQHDENIYTLYGHFSSLAVTEGDVVQKGQVIGYVGSTGDSTGNHLHLEYWVNGEYVDPMTLF